MRIRRDEMSRVTLSGTYNLPFSIIKNDPPEEVDPKLIHLLSEIDKYCGNKLYVHRLQDPKAKRSSQHFWGRAADIHIETMHVLDQYVLVERFNGATGLGVYPKDVWSITPGLHIDVRPQVIGSRWGYIGDGKGGREMVALSGNFFKHVMSL